MMDAGSGSLHGRFSILVFKNLSIINLSPTDLESQAQMGLMRHDVVACKLNETFIHV